MKLFFKYIFIGLFVCGFISIYPQSKYSVSFYGGYSLPLADLKGSFPDTLSEGNYLNFKKSNTLLTSSGFNIGAVGKYTVDTLGKARLTAGINYNTFSGSKDYPRLNGTLTYKNTLNIITVSAGAEYNFFPSKKINPFAGIDLTANFYSGKIEASGDSTFKITRKNESRFGVIINAGAEYKLSKSLSVIGGVKYALTNLIGRKSDAEITLPPVTDDEEPGSTIGSKELPLNDAETPTNLAKSIYYIQFYAGVTFYFGPKVK